MKIKSTRGFELEIEITGYQQEPEIKIIAPETVQGRKLAGRATMGQVKGQTGTHIRTTNQIAIALSDETVAAIRTEIDALPKRVYRIYEETTTANLDGHMLVYPKWVFEASVPGVSDLNIERMLRDAGITDITVDGAAEMWAERAAEIRRPFLEEAQRIGKPVEMSRVAVECDDPREECSADIITTYIHPDGSITRKRMHTW